MITILVMSSAKSSHLLPGFFHQWKKYWCKGGNVGLSTLDVVVTQSPVETPQGWYQFRADDDRPDIHWAGHLYKAIAKLATQSPVLLLMDDYWLCEPVDGGIIRRAAHELSVCDKVDLTGDRFGFAHREYNADYILSDEKAGYLASTQAALWDSRFLLSAIEDWSWNPWQFELEGTEALQKREKPVCILGAKSRPIQYANVSLRGQKRLRLDRLTSEDKRELLMVGAISKEDFFDE